MKILFIVSAVLLVVSCLLAFSMRERLQTVERVAFDTSAYDSNPIKISGLILRPRAAGSEKLPGIVFCHGLTTNKEIYLGLCRRIASLGIAVLVIDLRGHGHSSGASDFGKSEQHDVLAALDFLEARDDIDSEKLGVIGHSMGGITATRTAFLKGSEKIKVSIAIFCWQSMQTAVEAIFGPVETFVGRWWPFFGWSRQFPITDEEELAQRSIIEHLRPDALLNYMLVVGSRDPLTDMKRSAEIVAKAAGRSDIEPGVVYGSFSDRSARKFEIIKGRDHLTVLPSRRTHEVILEWLRESFELEKNAAGSHGSPSWIVGALRKVTMVLFVLSVIGCAGWLMSKGRPVPLASGIEAPLFGTSIMVLGGFVLCSALSIPIARAIGLRPFAPHWGIDIISLIMASRTAMFVPILAVLVGWRLGFGSRCAQLLGLTPASVLSGIAIAGLLFAWLVCSWNLVARTNWFPTLWPVVRAPTFFLLLGVLFVAYLAEESVFRGMIQTQLSGLQPTSQILLSALIYSVAASIALACALWTLFPSPMYAATIRSLSIPLLPVVFVVALAVFSAHGFLAALLFHSTGSIVAPAFFAALTVSFLFSGSIGVRTF